VFCITLILTHEIPRELAKPSPPPLNDRDVKPSIGWQGLQKNKPSDHNVLPQGIRELRL